MNTYSRKNLFYCGLLFSCVSYAEVEVKVPPSDELRTLVKSYDNQNAITGITVAYIPIKKPCINIIHKGKHTEYCFVNKGEDLSNSDKMGFYVTLKNAVKRKVSFSYNTLWYSMDCRIRVDENKISCDKPYG